MPPRRFISQKKIDDINQSDSLSQQMDAPMSACNTENTLTTTDIATQIHAQVNLVAGGDPTIDPHGALMGSNVNFDHLNHGKFEDRMFNLIAQFQVQAKLNGPNSPNASVYFAGIQSTMREHFKGQTMEEQNALKTIIRRLNVIKYQKSNSVVATGQLLSLFNSYDDLVVTQFGRLADQ